MLDLGCGNGRIVPLLQQKNCQVIGVDISERLLALAKKHYPQICFQKGGFSSIPAMDQSFDEVWAIASFHHLPTQKNRQQALQEIYRVLQTNGHVVMTVWNLWDQPQYTLQKKAAFWRSLLLPWWNKRDFLIPWGQEKTPRYYHSFSVRNIRNLARQNGFSLVECWGSHHGHRDDVDGSQNICFRLQKKH